MTNPPQNLYSRHGKRWLDTLVAAAGLIVFAAPMALIGAAILLTSGRPILFRQARVGRHGRLFRIAKFRTMTHRPVTGSTVTAAGDARITPLGRWLRRLKLDELPQLFNVLLGDMSFVGPRPDVPGYMDRLEGRAARLLELRPGITGPATLAFRHEEELLAGVADPERYNDEVIFPEKVRLNLAYQENLSFAEDLGCILQTVLPADFEFVTPVTTRRPARSVRPAPLRPSFLGAGAAELVPTPQVARR